MERWISLPCFLLRCKWTKSSLEAALKSLEIARTPDEKVNAYLTIGVQYNILGDYLSSIKFLLAGNAVEPSDVHLKVEIMIWLGVSYQGKGQNTEACIMFKDTLELAKTIDYTWGIDYANEGLTGCR